MSVMIIAVVAFLIDACIGDPRSRFHPVVLIGILILVLEKFLRRDSDGYIVKICKGGLLVATVLAVTYGIGVAIVYLLTVDGIISPLFYFAIGGLPLAIAYRAVNTMDSMLGYKNEKYLYFGKVAARMDDVANFIPARITAALFITSALILNLDFKNAFQMMWRDASKHPSPNGGYAEATVAGALNVQLGGINSYFGVPHFRAYMGDPNEFLQPYHIMLTIRMMYTATIIFLCLAILI